MTLEEMRKKAHEEECAGESPKCEFCKDTGVIVKVEWSDVSGRDESYEIMKKCICQED